MVLQAPEESSKIFFKVSVNSRQKLYFNVRALSISWGILGAPGRAYVSSFVAIRNFVYNFKTPQFCIAVFYEWALIKNIDCLV